MVMDYGMSGLGPIAFGSGHDEVFLGRDLGKGRNFSEEVAFEIDKEIRKLIDNGYKRAEKLLTDNINKLHAVAKRLLEKEKVEADEFLEIFNQA
jgi:ATP-dependent Zn proteases